MTALPAIAAVTLPVGAPEPLIVKMTATALVQPAGVRSAERRADTEAPGASASARSSATISIRCRGRAALSTTIASNTATFPTFRPRSCS